MVKIIFELDLNIERKAIEVTSVSCCCVEEQVEILIGKICKFAFIPICQYVFLVLCVIDFQIGQLRWIDYFRLG